MSRRELTVHGWVYKFESGQVFAYDPAAHEFVQLDRGLNKPSDKALSLPAI
jgi:carbonic anhydrase